MSSVLGFLFNVCLGLILSCVLVLGVAGPFILACVYQNPVFYLMYSLHAFLAMMEIKNV